MKIKSKIIYTIILIIFFYGIYIFFNKISSNEILLTINGERVVLNKDNSDYINLSTLNNENRVEIKKISGIGKIIINGKKLNKNETSIAGLSISPKSKISVEVTYLDGDKRYFIINTLPSSFPEYEINGISRHEGDYYLSTYSFEYDKGHYIFKLNESGNITYYKKTNMVSFDFKKEINSNGEIRYMYLEAIDNNFNGLTSLVPCELVIMNENYEEINRLQYKKDNKEIPLENHTYIYLDDNHYILATYKAVTKELNGVEINVLDCLIQEIKNGEVLWEFNSGDYEQLYSYSTLEKLDYSKQYQDYIHINSMSIDESDGNILCSFRNIDSILKINRSTGELMWILGGKGDEFNLSKKQKFSKQHSIVSISNNEILIYDNGNNKKRSRIIRMTIDEKNKKIKKFKEYDTNIYAFMMGSVRLIDDVSDTYLICYGGGNYSKNSIEEINYQKNEVEFSFTFKKNRYIYNVNKYK